MIESINIPKYKKSYLEEKINKLNRKAVKLGCQAMTLTFDNEHTVSYDEHPITGEMLLTPLVIPMVTAHLEYEIPMIEGYELVATLDIFPGENDNMVMVSAVPDVDVPTEYQNKNEIHCDHCGYKRNRHHSVLLKHTETGEYKEVGSTCVKDFFGHDPRGFMMMASIKFSHIVDSLGDERMGGYGGRDVLAWDLKTVLSVTLAVIKKFGWLSKTKAYEELAEPTADKVLRNLNPNPSDDKEDLVSCENDDNEIADKVIEHFENLDTNGNDYLLNCQKLTTLGYVPYKYMGFACSMVSSYQREMYKKEQEKNELPSDYVGEVGDRLKDVKAEVVFTLPIDSMYGPSTLYIFKDALGNVMKTFYSGTKWEYDKGDVVLLTGTVKKHQEYKGKKETMLNRVVCKDAPEEMFSENEFAVA